MNLGDIAAALSFGLFAARGSAAQDSPSRERGQPEATIIPERNWRDSLINVLSGIGVPGRDKATGTMYTWTPFDKTQLEIAFRSDWIARKVVECPAKDSTRAWRAWHTSIDTIETIEKLERRLNVQGQLYDGLLLSRLYGGAALIMGVDQGQPEEPLDLDTVKKDSLKFVHAVDRFQLSVDELIIDPFSPWYGEPAGYKLQSSITNSRSYTRELAPYIDVQIHPSRVVPLRGMFVPSNIVGNFDHFWGDSVLQIVMEAVRSAALVQAAVASLVNEAKFDVVKIPELSRHLATSDYQQRLIARFTFANTYKSIINTVLLDKEEEWQRVSYNFTGLPDILELYLLIVSGAADIPATRMLGQSPAGLQSTGESDVRNYYDRISSDQSNVLTPVLSRLDEILIRSATGSRNPSIYYVWNPLWQLDEKSTAEISYKKAQTFEIDVNLGIVNPEALRIGRQNQLIEDGTYPGLEQALEELGEMEIRPDDEITEEDVKPPIQTEPETPPELVL